MSRRMNDIFCSKKYNNFCLNKLSPSVLSIIHESRLDIDACKPLVDEGPEESGDEREDAEETEDHGQHHLGPFPQPDKYWCER